MRRLNLIGWVMGLLLIAGGTGIGAVRVISDFEDGSIQGYVPQGSTTSCTVDTDTASPNSLFSLKLTVDGAIDDSAKAELYFGPVDLTQYSYVSFYVKASDPRFLAGMMQMWPSEWWAGLGGHWRDESGQGADNWFRVEYAISQIEEWSEAGTWKPNECNGFQLQFAKPDPLASGSIWIDHMVFSDEPGEGVMSALPGAVLVVSDFEDGTTMGYTAIDGTDSVVLDNDTPSSLSLFSLRLDIDPEVGDNPAANPKTELYFGPVDITQYQYVSFYLKATDARFLGEITEDEQYFGMSQMWPSEWWAGLGGIWMQQHQAGPDTWFRVEYPISGITEWSEAGTWKPTECNGFMFEFHMPDPPVAGSIWIDHVVLSEKSGAGALMAGPSRLKVQGISLAEGGVELTWESAEGTPYEVRQAPGANGPWSLVETVAGTAGQTQFTDAAPLEAQKYYQVVQLPPPVLFRADFEPGEDLSGWTELVMVGDSQWEAGVPTSGPGSAFSGTQVYATKLGGDYELEAEVALRTPLIDLTGVTEATLRFWQWYEMEVEFDSGSVNLLDEDGNPLLLDPLHWITGVQNSWIRQTIPLPEEALGKKIMIEFFFYSDFMNALPGWYLDLVEIF